MHRRLLVIFAALVMVWSASAVNLNACGDKFLRIGRSPRSNAYAALHPASILLFVPDGASASDVKDFESALRHAGHRPTSVRGLDAFSDALGAAKYDIVIPILPDAPRVKARAASAPSKPEILPIVSKVKKSVLEELQREYGHVLTAGASKHDTLAVIDHVMESRLGSAAGAPPGTR